MKEKGFTAEQIIGKLREAEVLLGQGTTVVARESRTCSARRARGKEEGKEGLGDKRR